jgi:acetyl esterase/lipase
MPLQSRRGRQFQRTPQVPVGGTPPAQILARNVESPLLADLKCAERQVGAAAPAAPAAVGADPSLQFVAGGSNNMGMTTTLAFSMVRTGHQPIVGVILFSPKTDLLVAELSMSENTGPDILPWNVPTAGYLDGRDRTEPAVSAVDHDRSDRPPTLISFGDDEEFRDAVRRSVG